MRATPFTVPMPNSYSLRICSNSSPSLSSPSQASCLFRRMLRSCGGGVGSPRRLLPEAPTDPDVRISRIRLFGPRFRYVTGEVRRRGCGSGYRSSPHFSPRFKKGERSREKLPRSLFGKERAPVRTVVRRAAAFSRVLARAVSDCEQTSTSADGIALTSLVAGGAQMRSG